MGILPLPLAETLAGSRLQPDGVPLLSHRRSRGPKPASMLGRGRARNRSPTLQERNRACDFHRTRLLVTRSLSWIGFIGVTHRRPLLSTCWLLLCAGQRAVVKEPVVSRLVYIAVRRQSPCFTYTFTHTSISPRGVQIGLIIYVELLI